MEKKCGKCKTVKPLDNFSWKNKTKGTRCSWCKECKRQRMNNLYAANQESERKRLKTSNLQRRDDVQRKLLEYKMTNPCVDCGEDDPFVLDPDHRCDKKFNIASMVSHTKCRWEAVAAELAKCDIRCANCHRRKTAKEQGWYKRVLSPQSVVDARNSPKVAE